MRAKPTSYNAIGLRKRLTDIGLRRERKQVVSLPHAVFAIGFHPHRRHILGVANSDGSFAVYSVSKDGHNASYPRIEQMWHKAGERPGVSAVHFSWFPWAWFPIATTPYTDGFVLALSDGTTSTCILEPLPENPHDIAENKAGSWNFLTTEDLPQRRQNIEPWFVALATYENRNLPGKTESFMFTGDDMGTMWTQSYTSPEDGDHKSQLEDMWPQCKYRSTDDKARHHTAGITSILPLSISHVVQNAPIILTGSYDEYIRVYHATTKGSVLAEKRLGGGVWRLQYMHVTLIPPKPPGESSIWEEQHVILASCMHAGTRIVKVTWKTRGQSDDDIGDWDIEVMAQFTEHESMNYASGIWRAPNISKFTNERVFVSSSFYDKRLCLWKTEV